MDVKVSAVSYQIVNLLLPYYYIAPIPASFHISLYAASVFFKNWLYQLPEVFMILLCVLKSTCTIPNFG